VMVHQRVKLRIKFYNASWIKIWKSRIAELRFRTATGRYTLHFFKYEEDQDPRAHEDIALSDITELLDGEADATTADVADEEMLTIKRSVFGFTVPSPKALAPVTLRFANASDRDTWRSNLCEAMLQEQRLRTREFLATAGIMAPLVSAWSNGPGREAKQSVGAGREPEDAADQCLDHVAYGDFLVSQGVGQESKWFCQILLITSRGRGQGQGLIPLWQARSIPVSRSCGTADELLLDQTYVFGIDNQGFRFLEHKVASCSIIEIMFRSSPRNGFRLELDTTSGPKFFFDTPFRFVAERMCDHINLAARAQRAQQEGRLWTHSEEIQIFDAVDPDARADDDEAELADKMETAIVDYLRSGGQDVNQDSALLKSPSQPRVVHLAIVMARERMPVKHALAPLRDFRDRYMSVLAAAMLVQPEQPRLDIVELCLKRHHSRTSEVLAQLVAPLLSAQSGTVPSGAPHGDIVLLMRFVADSVKALAKCGVVDHYLEGVRDGLAKAWARRSTVSGCQLLHNVVVREFGDTRRSGVAPEVFYEDSGALCTDAPRAVFRFLGNNVSVAKDFAHTVPAMVHSVKEVLQILVWQYGQWMLHSLRKVIVTQDTRLIEENCQMVSPEWAAAQFRNSENLLSQFKELCAMVDDADFSFRSRGQNLQQDAAEGSDGAFDFIQQEIRPVAEMMPRLVRKKLAKWTVAEFEIRSRNRFWKDPVLTLLDQSVSRRVQHLKQILPSSHFAKVAINIFSYVLDVFLRRVLVKGSRQGREVVRRINGDRGVLREYGANVLLLTDSSDKRRPSQVERQMRVLDLCQSLIKAKSRDELNAAVNELMTTYGRGALGRPKSLREMLRLREDAPRNHLARPPLLGPELWSALDTGRDDEGSDLRPAEQPDETPPHAPNLMQQDFSWRSTGSNSTRRGFGRPEPPSLRSCPTADVINSSNTPEGLTIMEDAQPALESVGGRTQPWWVREGYLRVKVDVTGSDGFARVVGTGIKASANFVGSYIGSLGASSSMSHKEEGASERSRERWHRAWQAAGERPGVKYFRLKRDGKLYKYKDANDGISEDVVDLRCEAAVCDSGLENDGVFFVTHSKEGDSGDHAKQVLQLGVTWPGPEGAAERDVWVRSIAHVIQRAQLQKDDTGVVQPAQLPFRYYAGKMPEGSVRLRAIVEDDKYQRHTDLAGLVRQLSAQPASRHVGLSDFNPKDAPQLGMVTSALSPSCASLNSTASSLRLGAEERKCCCSRWFARKPSYTAEPSLHLPVSEISQNASAVRASHSPLVGR